MQSRLHRVRDGKNVWWLYKIFLSERVQKNKAQANGDRRIVKQNGRHSLSFQFCKKKPRIFLTTCQICKGDENFKNMKLENRRFFNMERRISMQM